jgi:predicted nucleic acid-binding protein
VSDSDRLESFLARHKKIGLDTGVFVYALEGHEKYASAALRVLRWVESRRGRAVTSTITMLEALVQPYRAGSPELVDGFYALLSTYPDLEWVEPDLEIADRAARLRAELNFRTPDAIQVATALCRSATGLVTHEKALKKVTGLDVLLLEESL